MKKISFSCRNSASLPVLVRTRLPKISARRNCFHYYSDLRAEKLHIACQNFVCLVEPREYWLVANMLFTNSPYKAGKGFILSTKHCPSTLLAPNKKGASCEIQENFDERSGGNRLDTIPNGQRFSNLIKAFKSTELNYSKVPNSSPQPLINFRKFFGPPRSY